MTIQACSFLAALCVTAGAVALIEQLEDVEHGDRGRENDGELE